MRQSRYWLVGALLVCGSSWISGCSEDTDGSHGLLTPWWPDAGEADAGPDDAGLYDGGHYDGGGADGGLCCDAQDVYCGAPCKTFSGFYWDGRDCQALNDCECVGSDCDKLYPTYDACAAEYSQCHPHPGLCFNNDGCKDDEFCRLEEGVCSADWPGTCELRPQDCNRSYDPVCGCDGNTYGNECNARAAGVNIVHRGECEPKPRHCGGRGAPYDCLPNEYCHFEGGSCGADDRSGICLPRPDVCTEIYAPVCGCDGQTYGNECYAGAAGVSVRHSGRCEEPPSCSQILCSPDTYCRTPVGTCGKGAATCAARPEACALYYAPVCGCDGKTYGNDCLAASAGVNVLRSGACEEPPDCRTTGCKKGYSCDFCWVGYSCIPNGAVC